MSTLYLDTSAIVKRYTSESGSAWLDAYIDPLSGNNTILSEITIAEFAAAICAKERARTISANQRSTALSLFLGHCRVEYRLLAVTRLVIDRAVLLTQNQPLRGYDAVQLATGLIVKEALASAGLANFVFVTADNNLLQVAQLEGLVVENPNFHP